MVEQRPDFTKIIERSSDGYFRHLNDDGLVFITPGFSEILQYSHEAFSANPQQLHEIIHPDESEEFRALLERLINGLSAQSSAVLRLVRSDQSEIWVEMFAVPVMDSEGGIIGIDGVVRDVSEHLQVADLLSRRSLELAALLDAQKALVSSLDYESTLQTIVEQANQLLKAQLSVIFQPDKEGQKIRPLAIANPGNIETGDLDLLIGEGISGWVVAKGESQLVDNLAQDPRGRRLKNQLGMDASLLVVPLVIGDDVAGVITVVGEVEQYEADDLRFLEALAQIAALALANSQNFQVVEQKASLDGLTGAHNRLFLDENLAQEVERADRLGYPLAVMMVDVDDLKGINDRHGHLAGDDVLKHLVGVLNSNSRETDWVARYGGDEFVVILPGCPEPILERLAERIKTATSQHDLDLTYSVSIGGAVRWPGAGGAEELLQFADDAERSAKEGGGAALNVHKGTP